MFDVAKASEEIVTAWPVIIDVPKSGGKSTRHKAHVDFQVFDQDKLDEMQLLGDDIQFLKKVIVGWHDKDFGQAGIPMEFNEENLEKVLKIAYVRMAMLREYQNVVGFGGKRKNL